MSRLCLRCFVAVVACLFVASNSWAQEEAAKKKDVPDKQAAQEKQAKAAEEQFKKMDKDGNGQLCLDEFRGKKGGEKQEAIFKLLDKDNSGSVCIVEYKNKPIEARFKTMDKDDDGSLTLEELVGNRKNDASQVDKAEQMFKKLDTNGDKKVCLVEFKAGQEKKPAKQAGEKKTQKKVKAEKQQ
ncbi:MAG: EF-hand domain-containing protein [Pirellulales bacterium]|nr:EF-hand domain-containing protein [Pirellulales bacterium]